MKPFSPLDIPGCTLWLDASHPHAYAYNWDGTVKYQRNLAGVPWWKRLGRFLDDSIKKLWFKIRGISYPSGPIVNEEGHVFMRDQSGNGHDLRPFPAYENAHWGRTLSEKEIHYIQKGLAEKHSISVPD